MAISDRIIAYYELDDATDSGAGGHDLTEVNTPTYTTGKVGNAMSVTVASTNYAYVPNASASAFQLGTRSLSVSVWVKPTALPASGNGASVIRMGASGGADAGYHIVYNNSGGTGQFLFRMSDGTTLYSITANGYATGSWYHVSWVMDRNGLARAYIDGAQVGTVDISAASATDISSDDDVRIGGSHQVYFEGLIDEVMFYDGVLSGDIRGTRYAGGSGISYSTLSSLARPFVSQEFIFEQETNTNNATAVVGDLVADQVALVLLSTDGNATGASLTAWDSAWTAEIDAVAPNTGTTFTRFRAWSHTVSATDVSTETQVAASWTNNEKATLVVQLWDNCAGVNVANESTVATSSTSFTEDGVTTTADGCQILVGISIDGGSTVTAFDAGLTFNDYQVTNAAGHSGLWWGSEAQASLGATGTYAFTVSGTTHCVPFSIAMEPNATAPTADGTATISDEVTGYAIGAKTASGLATISDEVLGYVVTSTARSGVAYLSDDISGYVTANKAANGTATISDEVSGYTVTATIRSGVAYISDEVVGYVTGDNGVKPSSIVLSIAHLNKVGITAAHINKITITISEVS